MRTHSQKDTCSGTVRTELIRSGTRAVPKRYLSSWVGSVDRFDAPGESRPACVLEDSCHREYGADLDGIVRLGNRQTQPVSVSRAVTSTSQRDSEVNRPSAQITQAMIGHV